MKEIVRSAILPVLIIGFICFTSCKDGAADRQQKIKEKAEIQFIEKEIEENVSPLPTSAEIIKMIADLEVGYIIGITNPFQNNKKYFSSSKRALNLGIYGADLSYVTLYNKQQDVINYLDAMRSLVSELSMYRTYDEKMYDDITRKFDDRDELVKMLTDSFNKTYAYLSDNEQQYLAILVVGGAWVEGMYLTTHLTYASHQYSGFSEILLEQKKSFEILLELTEPYSADPGVSDFLTLLEPVKTLYEGIGTSLTEQNIKEITRVISVVREEIVS